MKKYKVTLLEGDGIGPEIMQEAVKVLEALGQKNNLKFIFTKALIGGAAIDTTGNPLPKETIKACKKSHAVLLAAVGGSKWDNLPREKRPETGLLGIRKALKLFANLRPAKVFKELEHASSLKPEIISGIDLLVIRELTGGIYFGKPNKYTPQKALNTMVYKREEIERIATKAFEIARLRSKKVCSVDKANVLNVSQLWREVVIEVAKNYPDIELSHMYVDNCAMQLIRNPKQFDVIVTSNLFGDILSDEAAMLTGSIGMLPSASVGSKGPALYEPVHGSAPDIAGQNKANPLAMILSAAMMLQYSFDLPEEAGQIEKAVEKVLAEKYRTLDIKEEGCQIVSCSEMGDLVAKKL